MLEEINLENQVVIHKCWAAMRGNVVIATINMRVPNDVDFEQYRKKAQDALNMLGEVKAGEIVEIDNRRYFRQRLTHANRGKKPRKPKMFILFHPDDLDSQRTNK